MGLEITTKVVEGEVWVNAAELSDAFHTLGLHQTASKLRKPMLDVLLADQAESA